MNKPKLENPQLLKGNCLLHAHLMRKHRELNPKFARDLERMLELVRGVVFAMLLTKHASAESRAT
jgi:hypothetical protein